MTYSAPTPDELRAAARSAYEGQPESELHKHPAWRAANSIEQEADHFLAGTGTSSPTGIKEVMTQNERYRSCPISLPEPMARVVLDLYRTAYREGQALEEAEPLLQWIGTRYPHLFRELGWGTLIRQ